MIVDTDDLWLQAALKADTIMHSDVRRSIRYLSNGYREFFIDDLLVRIHFIIVMIRWTGLAPKKFEFPFPGSLTSTFLQATLLDRHWILFFSLYREIVTLPQVTLPQISTVT